MSLIGWGAISYGKQGKKMESITGSLNKIFPSRKLYYMLMLPTARRILHMCCCRPVCTKPALVLSSLVKDPIRRSSRYQACTSSMDGELNPAWKFQTTFHKPRTCLFVLQPERPLKEQRPLDKHQKMRHEIFWQLLLRTKWNVVLAHAAQLYVPSSTSGHWWTSMEPPSTKSTHKLACIHKRAKAWLSLASGTNPQGKRCLSSRKK